MKHIGENDSQSDFVTVLRMTSGQDSEPDFVLVEHAYALPWSSQSETTLCQPRKTLFLSKLFREKTSGSNEYIDIENISFQSTLPYDIEKGRHLMKECERHVVFAKLNQTSLATKEPEDDEDSDCDWIDKVNKNGWTDDQCNLFSSVTKILDGDYLAKLTLQNNANEPVKQRAVIDKTSGKFNQAMSRFGWDIKLAQWLHNILLQHMSTQYIASYLDILQTLKSKIPTCIDRMISHSFSQKKPNFEALNLLLKRPWDPVSPVFNQFKPLKMENQPIVIHVPSGAGLPNVPLNLRRFRFFNIQLQHLVKYVSISHTSADTVEGGTVLDAIITDVRKKIVEYKGQYPAQPIVLLGWGVGALLACHISLVEKVSANICLGFPMKSFDGMRGGSNDPLLSLNTPTLFIIGQNSTDVSVDSIEDFRTRLQTPTSLVVIAEGGNLMKVSADKCYFDGITQSMVDRCIVDEIGEFLTRVFNDDNNNKEIPAVTSNAASYISSSSSRRVFTNPLPPKTTRKEHPRKRKLSPSSLTDFGNSQSSKIQRISETRTAISQNLGLKIPVGISSVLPSLKNEKSLPTTSTSSSHVHFSVNSKGVSNMLELPQEASDSAIKRRQTSLIKDMGSTFRISQGGSNSDVIATKPVSSSFDGCSLTPGSSSPMATISLGALASVSRQKYQRMIQISDSSDLSLPDKKNIFEWNPKPSGKVDSEIGLVGKSSLVNTSARNRASDSSSEFHIQESDVKQVPQQNSRQVNVSECLAVGLTKSALNMVNCNVLSGSENLKNPVGCSEITNFDYLLDTNTNNELTTDKTTFKDNAFQSCMGAQQSSALFRTKLICNNKFQANYADCGGGVLLNNVGILPSLLSYEMSEREGILTPPYSPNYSALLTKPVTNDSIALPSSSSSQHMLSQHTLVANDSFTHNHPMQMYQFMESTFSSSSTLFPDSVTPSSPFKPIVHQCGPILPLLTSTDCCKTLLDTDYSKCHGRNRPHSYPYSSVSVLKGQESVSRSSSNTSQSLNSNQLNPGIKQGDIFSLNGETIIRHLKDLCQEIGLSSVSWQDLLPEDPMLYENFLNSLANNEFELDKIRNELYNKKLLKEHKNTTSETTNKLKSFCINDSDAPVNYQRLPANIKSDYHAKQKHKLNLKVSTLYPLNPISNKKCVVQTVPYFNSCTRLRTSFLSTAVVNNLSPLNSHVSNSDIILKRVKTNILPSCNSSMPGKRITMPKPIMSLIPMQSKPDAPSLFVQSVTSSEGVHHSHEKINFELPIDSFHNYSYNKINKKEKGESLLNANLSKNLIKMQKKSQKTKSASNFIGSTPLTTGNQTSLSEMINSRKLKSSQVYHKEIANIDFVPKEGLMEPFGKGGNHKTIPTLLDAKLCSKVAAKVCKMSSAKYSKNMGKPNHLSTFNLNIKSKKQSLILPKKKIDHHYKIIPNKLSPSCLFVDSHPALSDDSQSQPRSSWTVKVLHPKSQRNVAGSSGKNSHSCMIYNPWTNRLNPKGNIVRKKNVVYLDSSHNNVHKSNSELTVKTIELDSMKKAFGISNSVTIKKKSVMAPVASCSKLLIPCPPPKMLDSFNCNLNVLSKCSAIGTPAQPEKKKSIATVTDLDHPFKLKNRYAGILHSGHMGQGKKISSSVQSRPTIILSDPLYDVTENVLKNTNRLDVEIGKFSENDNHSEQVVIENCDEFQTLVLQQGLPKFKDIMQCNKDVFELDLLNLTNCVKESTAASSSKNKSIPNSSKHAIFINADHEYLSDKPGTECASEYSCSESDIKNQNMILIPPKTNLVIKRPFRNCRLRHYNRLAATCSD